MKRWLTTLYAPVFLGGFLALGIAVVGVAGRSPGWLLVIFLCALLVSFLAERALPYEPQWNHNQGDGWRDVAHALVNEACNGLALLILPGLVALLSFEGLWPGSWPLWGQVLLAIGIADAGISLTHYVSHHVPWMWRLHAVHHSVQRLYGFNGLMKHPLHQMLEAAVGFLPLIVLGVPLDVALLLAFAISLQLLLQHSNVDMTPGLLSHVFAWAPVHRLHHMKYGAAGNVNFGLFFNLWDRLLGTALHAGAYSIRQGELGIGNRADFPQGYVEQLLEPFRPEQFTDEPQVPEALRR